jgi:hypothetical protein
MYKTDSKERGVEGGSAASVYDQIVHSVAAHLRQQGFSSVKANSEGFSTPGKVKWEEEDEGVVPDITGEYKGSVYVFEIETGDQIEAKKVEDRWRLLSVYAKRHDGKFYLVIPETKADHLQKCVQDLSVQPQFLKLSGIE